MHALGFVRGFCAGPMFLGYSIILCVHFATLKIASHQICKDCLFLFVVTLLFVFFFFFFLHMRLQMTFCFKNFSTNQKKDCEGYTYRYLV